MLHFQPHEEAQTPMAPHFIRSLQALAVVLAATLGAEAAQKPPATGAALFRDAGIKQIIHQTSLENLPKIFRRGLRPGARGRGFSEGSMGPLFVGLVHKQASGQALRYTQNAVIGTNNTAILVYDLAPLDRSDYHVTSKWTFGRYYDFLSAKAGDTDGLQRVVRDISKSLTPLRNEVVFPKGSAPIDTRSLKQIWVAPGERKAVMKALTQEGISQINGVAIGRLIKERAIVP